MRQIAFEIPFYWAGHWSSLPVYWYGVLVGIGLLFGLWRSSRLAPRAGIPSEKVLDAAPWLIAGGILGGRALYVLSYWHEQFAQAPWTQVFAIRNGGLVFYGGLIGATVFLLGYLWYRKIPFYKFADVLAPGLALGYGIGRLGCLMNGCCYGAISHLPWAVHFPFGHNTHPNGVHPTQVYESLLNIGLYFGLAWLYPRRKFDGQVMALYLVCYPFLRFVVEFFRGDYQVRYLGGWASPAQLVSMGIIGCGLLAYALLRKRGIPAHA